MASFTSFEFVDAFYQLLLLRNSDPAGRANWCDLLDKGELDVHGLMQRFLRSDEFRQNLSRFVDEYKLVSSDRFVCEHSEYGEVPLLIRRMVDAGTKHRFIVDVGARGRERSNSYDLLAGFGWKGLLIEANPRLIPTIRSEFDGLNCEVVNVAVSDYNGTSTFTIGINDDVSSLDAASARCWGSTRGTIEVEVRRLGDILSAAHVPFDFDVLSLDIEGEDLKVLNDLITNTIFIPRWVIVEASAEFTVSSLDQIAVQQAVKDHYRLVNRTRANLILEKFC